VRPTVHEKRLRELGIMHPGSTGSRLSHIDTPIADVLAYGWADDDDPAWGAVEEVRVVLLGLSEASGNESSMLDRTLRTCARRLKAAHALALRISDPYREEGIKLAAEMRATAPSRYEGPESAPEPDDVAQETQPTPRSTPKEATPPQRGKKK